MAKKVKRVYRSKNDKIIGGVAAGIAEYLNTDPTVVRLIFVVLAFVSFGSALLAYLIAWMIIPEN